MDFEPYLENNRASDRAQTQFSLIKFYYSQVKLLKFQDHGQRSQFSP